MLVSVRRSPSPAETSGPILLKGESKMNKRNKYKLRTAPLIQFRSDFQKLADKESQVSVIAAGVVCEPSIIANPTPPYKFETVHETIAESLCGWAEKLVFQAFHELLPTQEEWNTLFLTPFILGGPKPPFKDLPLCDGCIRFIFENEIQRIEKDFSKHFRLDYSNRIRTGERKMGFCDYETWKSDASTHIPYGSVSLFVDFMKIVQRVEQAMECNWIDKVFQLAYERRLGYPLRTFGSCAKTVGKYVIANDQYVAVEEYLQNFVEYDDKGYQENRRASICYSPIYWFSCMPDIIQASVDAMNMLCDDIEAGAEFENNTPFHQRSESFFHSPYRKNLSWSLSEPISFPPESTIEGWILVLVEFIKGLRSREGERTENDINEQWNWYKQSALSYIKDNAMDDSVPHSKSKRQDSTTQKRRSRKTVKEKIGKAKVLLYESMRKGNGMADSEIAKAVGLNKSQLSKSEEYQDFANLLRTGKVSEEWKPPK